MGEGLRDMRNSIGPDPRAANRRAREQTSARASAPRHHTALAQHSHLLHTYSSTFFPFFFSSLENERRRSDGGMWVNRSRPPICPTRPYLLPPWAGGMVQRVELLLSPKITSKFKITRSFRKLRDFEKQPTSSAVPVALGKREKEPCQLLFGERE